MSATVRRPCKACGKMLLFAFDGRTGKTVALDVETRQDVYELLDAAEGEVAYPVNQQEVYLRHGFRCAGIQPTTQPTQKELL